MVMITEEILQYHGLFQVYNYCFTLFSSCSFLSYSVVSWLIFSSTNWISCSNLTFLRKRAISRFDSFDRPVSHFHLSKFLCEMDFLIFCPVQVAYVSITFFNESFSGLTSELLMINAVLGISGSQSLKQKRLQWVNAFFRPFEPICLNFMNRKRKKTNIFRFNMFLLTQCSSISVNALRPNNIFCCHRICICLVMYEKILYLLKLAILILFNRTEKADLENVWTTKANDH